MADVPTVTELQQLGLAAGLAAVGVTSADILEPARSVLSRRKEAGLAGEMQFTYRNPDRSSDPRRIIKSARSIVAGAYNYFQGEQKPVDALSGRIARYAWDNYYLELEKGLQPIADELQRRGFEARVVADSNALVDRNVAWRAGLGWYGKNANILIPGSGSWFVLGAVVTNAELEVTGPPLEDQCGSCSTCISECPTGAIVGPGKIDARRCLAWIVQAGGDIPREYRAAIGDRIYGCDDCQSVCPPNRAAPVQITYSPKKSRVAIEPGSSHAPEDEPRKVGSRGWADIVWVLTASDDLLLARYGRWYIAGRDCDVIRRTALVVLGNTADPENLEAANLLEKYLSHPNPRLRSHAVWAAKRLGRDDILPVTDPNPGVQQELLAKVGRRAEQKEV